MVQLVKADISETSRRKGNTQYTPMIEEFMESGEKCMKVRRLDGNPPLRTMRVGLSVARTRANLTRADLDIVYLGAKGGYDEGLFLINPNIDL